MPDPAKSPAAIVREHASLRIAEQEAVAMWKNIIRDETRRLESYRELGLRLLPVRAAKKGDGFESWLREKDIPPERAREAIRLAENWKWIGGRCRSKREALKLIRENVFATESEGGEIDPEIQVEAEKRLADSARVDPEIKPPTALGDAAEDVPESVIFDAEGKPLPDNAKLALEDDSVERWCDQVKACFDALPDVAQKPSGRFVDVKTLKLKLSSVARMARARKPTLETIYRCPKCNGNGCKMCQKAGWLPKCLFGAP